MKPGRLFAVAAAVLFIASAGLLRSANAIADASRDDSPGRCGLEFHGLLAIIDFKVLPVYSIMAGAKQIRSATTFNDALGILAEVSSQPDQLCQIVAHDCEIDMENLNIIYKNDAGKAVKATHVNTYFGAKAKLHDKLERLQMAGICN